ncbi:MAG: UvrB/UvrC motif-containing protein [Clostridia bacterium]|nr:UvrB/UvrC motif-containing protein [Clostridia bacterium]
MLCEICKKNEATFFTKYVIMGETITRAYCASCAAKYKEDKILNNPGLSQLIESLMSFAGDELIEQPKKKVTKKQKEKTCPKCGSTYEDVIISLHPGCEECYKTFNKEISEMISRVSKDITFVGDMPKSAGFKEADDRMTLRNLKVDLNEALKEEDYEEAARLRDEIKKIEKKIKNDNRK